MTSVRLTHIGGPTVLLEFEGWRVLTDPTFDAPGQRYKFGWGTASRKVAGPAVAAADIGPIDVVLLTHDHHADNLDDAGRRLTAGVDEVLTTVAGAGRLGGSTRGLAPWATATLTRDGRVPLQITATPCRHGPPGSKPIVGQVIGFSLRWEGQHHGELWISGDTVLYDGVRQVGERLDVGTAIVHLGGVRFPITGPLRYTMTAHDAVDLLAGIGPTTIVPVHYEGWSHFQEARSAIDATFAAAPGDLHERVTWAELGQPVELTV